MYYSVLNKHQGYQFNDYYISSFVAPPNITDEQLYNQQFLHNVKCRCVPPVLYNGFIYFNASVDEPDLEIVAWRAVTNVPYRKLGLFIEVVIRKTTVTILLCY